jgi:hypothetical protein
MPRGPKGEKRPADVIGNAVRVMRIATGEESETLPEDDGKDPAAKALGKKGGAARAKFAPWFVALLLLFPLAFSSKRLNLDRNDRESGLNCN